MLVLGRRKKEKGKEKRKKEKGKEKRKKEKGKSNGDVDWIGLDG